MWHQRFDGDNDAGLVNYSLKAVHHLADRRFMGLPLGFLSKQGDDAFRHGAAD
jgi:hypothetical protein